MQKGFTNIRPVQIQTKFEGPRSIIIFNNSGVNLWLGDDEVSANKDTGVPIPPNASLGPGIYVGDLFVGADVDNTEFRYIKSKMEYLPNVGTKQGKF